MYSYCIFCQTITLYTAYILFTILHALCCTDDVHRYVSIAHVFYVHGCIPRIPRLCVIHLYVWYAYGKRICRCMYIMGMRVLSRLIKLSFLYQRYYYTPILYHSERYVLPFYYFTQRTNYFVTIINVRRSKIM